MPVTALVILVTRTEAFNQYSSLYASRAHKYVFRATD